MLLPAITLLNLLQCRGTTLSSVQLVRGSKRLRSTTLITMNGQGLLTTNANSATFGQMLTTKVNL